MMLALTEVIPSPMPRQDVGPGVVRQLLSAARNMPQDGEQEWEAKRRVGE